VIFPLTVIADGDYAFDKDDLLLVHSLNMSNDKPKRSPKPIQPSLLQIVERFPTEEKCIAHFERIRWPEGPICPRCDGKRISTFEAKGKTGKPRHLYECIDCHYQYSVTVGTIFHDSHIPLRKWFIAIYLICTARKGISALRLQEYLGVGQWRTAWYMANRIRLAMGEDSEFSQKFSGIVEADETYIGGKAKGPRGRGAANKTPVIGIRERTSGKVRLQAVKNVTGHTIADFIRHHVSDGAMLHTDEFSGYFWLDSSEFAHKSVNHSETYVGPDGVHTNGIGNVWSLFKRAVMGTFHKVSTKYLPLYLDEFSFRFNNRGEFNLMDRVLERCN
jgi:transposase-like protein